MTLSRGRTGGAQSPLRRPDSISIIDNTGDTLALHDTPNSPHREHDPRARQGWQHGRSVKPGEPVTFRSGGLAFFTTDPEAAQWYAQNRGAGEPKVTDARLNIANPATYDDLMEVVQQLGVDEHDVEQHSNYYGDNDTDYLYVPAVRQELERRGFDGYSAWDAFLNREVPIAVAFDPGQVQPLTKHLQGEHNQKDHGRKGATFFHATPPRNLKTIFERGLIRGFSEKTEHSKDGVYLASHLEGAETVGMMLAKYRGDDTFAVLELDLSAMHDVPLHGARQYVDTLEQAKALRWHSDRDTNPTADPEYSVYRDNDWDPYKVFDEDIPPDAVVSYRLYKVTRAGALPTGEWHKADPSLIAAAEYSLYVPIARSKLRLPSSVAKHLPGQHDQQDHAGDSHRSEDEANSWHQRLPDASTDKRLTDKQQRTYMWYTGGGYKPINRFLRTGEVMAGYDEDPGRIKSAVRTLDAAFKRADTLPEGVQLIRGVKGRLDVKPGAVLTDKAYQSTSVRDTAASGFSGWEGTVLEYRGMSGTPFLGGNKGEGEVLLPRGLRLRVAAVEPAEPGKAQRVVVVPDDSSVRKHLPGQHDQKTHGREHGARVNEERVQRCWEAPKYAPDGSEYNTVATERRLTTEDFAQRNGMSVEQYRAALDKHLKDGLAAMPIEVRVPEKALGRILADGGFKSMQELGRTGVPGAKQSEYQAERNKAEDGLFGYPEDTPAEARPIYGYGGDLGVDNAERYYSKKPEMQTRERGKWTAHELLSTYGNIRAVLDDSVKSRATVTFGDSLDGFWMFGEDPPVGTPTAWNDPKDVSIHGRLLGHYGDPLHTPVADQGSPFIEAQVHGGIDLDEVKEFIFEEDPDEATQRKLGKAGVRWRVERKWGPDLRGKRFNPRQGAWEPASKAILEKHLPGRHDQQDHGNPNAAEELGLHNVTEVDNVPERRPCLVAPDGQVFVVGTGVMSTHWQAFVTPDELARADKELGSGRDEYLLPLMDQAMDRMDKAIGSGKLMRVRWTSEGAYCAFGGDNERAAVRFIDEVIQRMPLNAYTYIDLDRVGPDGRPDKSWHGTVGEYLETKRLFKSWRVGDLWGERLNLDWRESDHPRDESGRFTETAGAHKQPSETTRAGWLGGDAYALNDALRGGGKLTDEQKRAVRELDKFTAQPLPAGKLYRAVYSEDYGAGRALITAARMVTEGEDFLRVMAIAPALARGLSDPGFTSTTASPAWADHMLTSKDHGEHNLLLDIDVPEGAHGGAVKETFGLKPGGKGSDIVGDEVVLPRNARLTVTGFSPGPKRGTFVVHTALESSAAGDNVPHAVGDAFERAQRVFGTDWLTARQLDVPDATLRGLAQRGVLERQRHQAGRAGYNSYRLKKAWQRGSLFTWRNGSLFG